MANITADQDAALRQQLGVLHLALREAGIRSLLIGRRSLHLTRRTRSPAQRQQPYLVVFGPDSNPSRRLWVTTDDQPDPAFYWHDDRGTAQPVLGSADAAAAIAAIVNVPVVD
jgi:hypothetical protein